MAQWNGEPITDIVISERDQNELEEKVHCFWAIAYFAPNPNMVQYGYAAYPPTVVQIGKTKEEAVGLLILDLANRGMLSFKVQTHEASDQPVIKSME